MHLITMKFSDLTPAPYNPRLSLSRDDPRYRKLRRSLQRFGLVEPLIWNQRTGHLVAGHLRLQILRELHHHDAPVSVIDLPLDQEKALNIILNNRYAQGDWDVPQLTCLLDELASLPESMLSATGFDPAHLSMLQSELAPSKDPLEDQPHETCEITLCIPMPQLPAIRPELDALIDRYQLEVHVRER